jgi:hypothetical protein
VQDNDGACVGELQGPDRVSEPYAWVRDAEGREVASLAADLSLPSGWRNKVHPLRFVLFSDGAAVGSMDPKMKRVFVSGAGEVALSIERTRRGRFALSSTSALPAHLVDTFWWFGLMAAVCRGRWLLYHGVFGGDGVGYGGGWA